MLRQPLIRPIVIVGAARSGTKMLRGALAAHPRLAAVPYDINYVWKVGYYDVPHDELAPEQATLLTRAYIRWFLRSYLPRRPRKRLIEKTVSNCLRIPFVRRVLPDCQFVHLLRDGRDVTTSARRLWTAPPDWKALSVKLRSFPWLAVPSYGTQYARSYLERRRTSTRQVSSWGPRFRGIDSFAGEHSLLEVCARQWQSCVEKATTDLALIPEGDVITVRYEDLVTNPIQELTRLLDFVGLDLTHELTEHAAQKIVPHHRGKWQSEVEPEEAETLQKLLAPTLATLGYAE